VSLKYGVLCLFALLIAVLLALKNYETWTMPLAVPIEKASPKKSSAKPEGSQPPGEQKEPKAAPSIASYIFIAEKNPFNPDRKEFPVTAGPPMEVKKPIVRPQVTLYGVTIAGDYRSASLSYPGRPLQKGEREVATMKIGDRVGEYKLARILEDRIGLETPEDSFEVPLYDIKTPKKRVYARTENKPAAVTSTLPGTPAPAAAEGAKPAPPGTSGTPIREGVAAAPVPAPLTRSATPPPATSRTRRWLGPRPGEGGE
jgi:hypothetical protein